MTIERFESGFGYVVHCDFCDEELYLMDSEYFQDALREMKEYGWKSRKENDEWVNICPDCLAKELKEKPG